MAIFEYAQQIGLLKPINEGFLSQLTMTNKIKPKMTTEQILKQHKYPGVYNLIDKIDSLDDLLYLRKDFNTAMGTFKTIQERIELCEKYGECEKTKNYYKGIKKLYIDKGITSKDVELTIKWYKEVYYKKLSEKIKKVRQESKN